MYNIYLSDSTLIEEPIGSPPQIHTDSLGTIVRISILSSWVTSNSFLSGNDGILRLSYFSFFVVSLAAIGVSVDTIHKERQSNTLNMLLARPINRETIILGKALGLTMVVGVPGS